MASPQTENGYTRIANELLEALAKHRSLGSEAFQVLMMVFRYTYGFNRKEGLLTVSFIVVGTGLKQPNVNRAIERLISKRIIKREKSTIGFNKNYDEWAISKRIYHIRTDIESISKRRDKKENTKKEQLAKQKVSPSPSVGPDSEPPPPVARPPSPIQRVVEAYMDAQGFLPTQRAPAFKRHVAPAKRLLEAVGGDVEAAITAIWECKRWSATRTWTLETVLNHLHRFMELS